jgi:beta-N-acetylhexosaminidase
VDRRAWFVGISLLVLITALVAACGDDTEAGVDRLDPDIRGEITSRTEGTGDTLGTILIEGEVEPDTTYDKASTRIDGDTEIYRLENGGLVEASWDDLQPEVTVEATFEGPVAESYPVQAYASQVVIIG